MRSVLRTGLLGVLLAPILSAGSGEARTWRITPDGTGDAATIQAGMDSAQVGDEVVLAAGVYSWTSQGATGQTMVSMKAGVTLRSEAGPEATTLEAERAGRVLRCVGADGTRIEGLTIKRGMPGVGDPAQFPDPPRGGGIFMIDSDCVVENCIIRENRTMSLESGGGVYAVGGTIRNCQILNNSTGLDGCGGGIYAIGTLIAECTIRGNTCGGDSGSSGGGVFSIGATIRDCWFENNIAANAFNGLGGGVYEGGTGSIERCTFIDNSAFAANHGPGLGGGIYVASSCAITDCVFIRNSAIGVGVRAEGGAIAGNSSSSLTVRGCTLVANRAEGGGLGQSIGGIRFYAGSVESSIIAFNEGLGCLSDIGDLGEGTMSCCNVFGNTLGDDFCGVDGGGNFSADPQFCAADPAMSLNVTLQSDSPSAPGNHPDGTACGLIGAGPVSCGTVSVEKRSWSEIKAHYRR